MKYFLLATIGFFSLLMGSFITMLVYRLPLILQKQWQKEHQQFLSEEKSNDLDKKFNIFLPFSHCPNCQQNLTILQKIPLLSYFFLKGKCAHCQRKISFRYPLIEILTLFCSLFVIERFGFNLQMLASLILTWGLLSLAFIDLEQGILPDNLVFPLLWLGLIANIVHLFVSPEAAILGASLAYLSLFVLAKGYQLIIKREAMGQGDFKCFALLGAWLGIRPLPYILFIAAFLGSLAGIILYIMEKNSLRKSIAFGPYLAIAAWFVFMYSYPSP